MLRRVFNDVPVNASTLKFMRESLKTGLNCSMPSARLSAGGRSLSLIQMMTLSCTTAALMFTCLSTTARSSKSPSSPYM